MIAEHKAKWKLCILEAATTYVKIKITVHCNFVYDQQYAEDLSVEVNHNVKKQNKTNKIDT